MAAALGIATVASARKDYLSGDRLTDRTQVIMWPSYAVFAAALAQELRRRVVSLPLRKRPARIAGMLLAATGGGLFAGGAGQFRSFMGLAGRETERLITDGLYRYTRNPQYLGSLMVSAGVSLWARSGTGMFQTGGAYALYEWYLPAEEAHLERVFGEEYRRYKQRTGRWIGRKFDS